VTLPRLRDRSDFEAIVHHLLGAIDPNCEITPAKIARLAARPWPGNNSQLRNMLARFTLANATTSSTRPRGGHDRSGPAYDA